MGNNTFLINCDGNGYASTGDTMQCLAQEANKICSPKAFKFLDSKTKSSPHIGVNFVNGDDVRSIRPHSAATIQCY